MSAQVSWHVELQVKPGQLQAFRALTAEMVEATKNEGRALIYERFISDDGRVVHVFERYLDSAAAVEHLIAFAKRYGETFSTMVDRERFVVWGTPSPELKQILDPLGATYMSPLAGFSRLG